MKTWFAAESEVNELAPRYPQFIMCLYDLDLFDGETVMYVLKTHPRIFVNGLIITNPHYIPEEAVPRQPMTPAARRVPSANDLEPAVQARLSSVNAVFTLSLILTQASSPGQVMRLVTTAVPSIAPCQKALAWHPSRSGGYYQRAPDDAGDALARLTGPGRLETGGLASCWAFPLTSQLAREPVFLIIVGSEPLSEEETFLLSVLAQLCGTVIAKLELIAAERTSTQQVATLNAELESTVSTLTRIMEIHRRLNEIVANAGEMGIAETLHQLTTFPVLIQDVHGGTRAAAGDFPGDHLAGERPGQRRETHPAAADRAPRASTTARRGWSWPTRGADVLGVIALIDPARTAGEIDLAALEYAAHRAERGTRPPAECWPRRSCAARRPASVTSPRPGRRSSPRARPASAPSSKPPSTPSSASTRTAGSPTSTARSSTSSGTGLMK